MNASNVERCFKALCAVREGSVCPCVADNQVGHGGILRNKAKEKERTGAGESTLKKRSRGLEGASSRCSVNAAIETCLVWLKEDLLICERVLHFNAGTAF